ncbi:MAG: CerR family C-terminal domain-containing protein [Holophagaceae bacterium]|nr:CerR family C-terminal domain-containing protein [Holophagaceae bacterium]
MDTAAQVTPHKETARVLLESAILCFAEKGFDGTSIREIADMAGKQVSLIGYHFGNKEGLYLSCFQHMFTRFPRTPLRPVRGGLDAIRKDRHLAAQVLRSAIQGIVQDMFADDGDPLKESFIRLFMMEMRSPRPVLHELYLERISDTVQLLRTCIASLQPNLPNTEVSFLGQSILGQCLIHRLAAGMNALVWQPLPPFASPQATADRIADFVLQGLGYRGRP